MNNKKITIVFPGQGSQSIGMLQDIAQQFSEVQHTFTEASDLLQYDLWKLTQEGPKEKLDATEYTQPALLTASIALWRIINKDHPVKVDFLAGHSLGEYTALVAADSLAFEDAVKLVALRGKYMQEAVPNEIGGMAALIGLDDAKVIAICKEAGSETEIVTPANFNSIGQVVVAGHKTAVLRAIALAKEQGAKLATLLPVSVPSHCKLMQKAAQRLAEKLVDIQFKTPRINIINNVDVDLYRTADDIRDGLVRQLCKPVQWVQTIEKLITDGVSQIIECGPGKVLTGLNKRISKDLNLISLSEIDKLTEFLKVKDEDAHA